MKKVITSNESKINVAKTCRYLNRNNCRGIKDMLLWKIRKERRLYNEAMSKRQHKSIDHLKSLSDEFNTNVGRFCQWAKNEV